MLKVIQEAEKGKEKSKSVLIRLNIKTYFCCLFSCFLSCSFSSSGMAYNSQSGYHRRLMMTRSGRKIKGRGQRVCLTKLLFGPLHLEFCTLLHLGCNTQYYVNPFIILVGRFVGSTYQVLFSPILVVPNSVTLSFEVQRPF